MLGVSPEGHTCTSPTLMRLKPYGVREAQVQVSGRCVSQWFTQIPVQKIRVSRVRY